MIAIFNQSPIDQSLIHSSDESFRALSLEEKINAIFEREPYQSSLFDTNAIVIGFEKRSFVQMIETVYANSSQGLSSTECLAALNFAKENQTVWSDLSYFFRKMTPSLKSPSIYTRFIELAGNMKQIDLVESAYTEAFNLEKTDENVFIAYIEAVNETNYLNRATTLYNQLVNTNRSTPCIHNTYIKAARNACNELEARRSYLLATNMQQTNEDTHVIYNNMKQISY